jgi:hypothetical protein
LQPEAVGIKNTKTTSVFVPGNMGNPYQRREGGNFDAPIAIMFEALGMNPVKSPGVGMPGETKAAFALQHKGKMLLELLFLVVKTFHLT